MRDLQWALTKTEFKTFIQGVCYWCGIVGGTETKAPRYGSQGDRFMRNNGIDRLDNAQGYTLQNCVTACKHCNLARNDMSIEEFKEWLKRAAEYTLSRASGEK
jgi:5-methylcytosine-specific restriction endonuclease McrA